MGKEKQKLVNLGWSSDNVTVHVDALWEALTMKARSPDKFMDVSDVKVSDEDGYLSRSMTIKANNKIVKERIWINRVASEIVFQPLHPDTGAPLHEERLQCERNRICILSSTSEMSQMECGHPGNFLLTWCQRVFRRWSKLRRNSKAQCSLLLGWVSTHLPWRTSTTMPCGWLC